MSMLNSNKGDITIIVLLLIVGLIVVFSGGPMYSMYGTPFFFASFYFMERIDRREKSKLINKEFFSDRD